MTAYAGDARPIVVGDSFETLDKRDGGRVVEVIEDVGHHGRAVFRVRTEAHPRNPDAVGNVSRVSDHTLRTNYKRVSR